MTFFEYVQAEYVDGFPVYKGDTPRFFCEHGMDKIQPEAVAQAALHFASQGIALGAAYPELIRAMFERTHAERPKEEWEQAYAAGLDIGPEQPRTSYKEAEEVEDKEFMDYCREFRPEIYSILMRSGGTVPNHMNLQEFVSISKAAECASPGIATAAEIM